MKFVALAVWLLVGALIATLGRSYLDDGVRDLFGIGFGVGISWTLLLLLFYRRADSRAREGGGREG